MQAIRATVDALGLSERLNFDPVAVALVSIAGAAACFVALWFRQPPLNQSQYLKKYHAETTVRSSARVIHPLRFQEYRVAEVQQISHNSKLLRLQLPSSQALNLPAGRHVTLMANIDGQKVMRPYTPVTESSTKGHFDIVFKAYELGLMSRYLDSLRPGDMIHARGPTGRLRYKANQWNRILLIGAGTGITPVLQLARTILRDSDDNTHVELYYQNREERDVLLKQDIDDLRNQYPNQFAVTYFLSRYVSFHGLFTATHCNIGKPHQRA